MCEAENAQSVSSRNILTSWLFNNGCFITKHPIKPNVPHEEKKKEKEDEEEKKKKPREQTHLLMNGGRLSIPDTLHEQFFAAMAKALAIQGAWLYVVETKTRVFRMMAELDLVYYGHAVSEEELLGSYVPVLHRAVLAVCPDADRLVVCTSEGKVLEKDPNDKRPEDKIKSGVHLIWPDTRVSIAQARTLRAVMIRAAMRDIPAPEGNAGPVGGWPTAFDPCIFDANGLRMIHSRKAGPCPDCKGTSKQAFTRDQLRTKSGGGGNHYTTSIPAPLLDVINCHTCKNQGKVDLGRPYRILGLYSSRGREVDARELVAIMKDLMASLKITSIRIVPRIDVTNCSSMNTPRELLLDIDPYISIKLGPAPNNNKRKEPPATGGLDAPRKGAGGCDKRAKKDTRAFNLQPLSHMEPDHRTICQYFMEVYKISVRNIVVAPHRHMYRINTNSKYCSNKGGEHSTSTAIYHLYSSGMVQKCWSRNGKVYGPRGVSCEGYSSPIQDYHPNWMSQMRSLFPTRNKARLSGGYHTSAPARTPGTTTANVVSVVSPAVQMYPEMSGMNFVERLALMEERRRLREELQSKHDQMDRDEREMQNIVQRIGAPSDDGEEDEEA
jgi:hypothetical protein